MFGSYGDQQALSGQNSGIRPWRIFFPRRSQPALYELDHYKVGFLVVDRRDSKLLPLIGWYFAESEPEREAASGRCRSGPRGIRPQPPFERIYDNGNILIYRYLPAGEDAGRGLMGRG